MKFIVDRQLPPKLSAYLVALLLKNCSEAEVQRFIWVGSQVLCVYWDPSDGETPKWPAINFNVSVQPPNLVIDSSGFYFRFLSEGSILSRATTSF